MRYDSSMPRIPYPELLAAFQRAFVFLGLSPERAELCGHLFAETTRDGVYSHGINRFPRFANSIRNGSVHPAAEPERIAAFGGLER